MDHGCLKITCTRNKMHFLVYVRMCILSGDLQEGKGLVVSVVVLGGGGLL
jgi:hypothetical protein